MVNVQFQYLLDQLRPLLRHSVAHPKSVNATNAPILPIMLATKLLPGGFGFGGGGWGGRVRAPWQRGAGQRSLLCSWDEKKAHATPPLHIWRRRRRPCWRHKGKKIAQATK